MPKLTKRFQKRFPAPQEPLDLTEEMLRTQKPAPGRPRKVQPTQPLFKKGQYLRVHSGRYKNKIGHIEDLVWDKDIDNPVTGLPGTWVYTAFTTDRHEAINPYEFEADLYVMPKSARTEHVTEVPMSRAFDSSRQFPAPSWMSSAEQGEWRKVFDRLGNQAVSPHLAADGFTQVAIFALSRLRLLETTQQ